MNLLQLSVVVHNKCNSIRHKIMNKIPFMKAKLKLKLSSSTMKLHYRVKSIAFQKICQNETETNCSITNILFQLVFVDDNIAPELLFTGTNGATDVTFITKTKSCLQILCLIHVLLFYYYFLIFSNTKYFGLIWQF